MANPVPHDPWQKEKERLGLRIRTLRQERGWSQDTFAHLAGLNRSYPHKVESGSVDVRFSTLLRIAQVLELTVAELLADAPSK